MARPEVRATCPHCGADRVTRAQRGVWIACLECGEQFRRAADAPEVSGDAPGAPGAPATAPAGAPGSVKVARATPVVSQVARPRPRAGEASKKGAVPAHDPAPATQEDAPAPGPATSAPELEAALDYDREAARRPPNQDRARAAGRKGGLAIYKGMIG